MRENRLYGSEGGGPGNRFSLPLSEGRDSSRGHGFRLSPEQSIIGRRCHRFGGHRGPVGDFAVALVHARRGVVARPRRC